MRSAKNAYFDKLIETDKSTSTIWKAIDEIASKSHRKTSSSTTHISTNIFNSHFLTLAETSARSNGFISANLACCKSLRFLFKKIKMMISDSSLTTDTKLRSLGLLPLKEKFMFNEAVQC